MEKLLDKLKHDLNIMVDQPELIHDKSFMMWKMDPWSADLPTFQEYMYHKLKQQKTTYFNSTSTTKSILLNYIKKELFSLTDQ